MLEVSEWNKVLDPGRAAPALELCPCDVCSSKAFGDHVHYGSPVILRTCISGRKT